MRKYLITVIILAIALLPAGVLAESGRGACLSGDQCPVISGEARDQVRGLLNQVNRTAIEEQLNRPVIELNGTDYSIRDMIRQHQGVLENMSAFDPSNQTWRFPGMIPGYCSVLPAECQPYCEELMNGACLPFCGGCPYIDGTSDSPAGPAGMPRWGGAPSLDGRVPQVTVQPGEYLPYL